MHPRYADWISRSGQHKYLRDQDLSEWDFDHWIHDKLPVTEDDYFDRAATQKALGKNWEKAIRGDSSPQMLPKLAAFIGVDLEELTAEWQKRRKYVNDKSMMLSCCRWHPAKLMSWEHVRRGTPCPACGRPWFMIGEDGEIIELDDHNEPTKDDFLAAHEKCNTMTQQFAEGLCHCSRCCGFPPVNPEILANVNRILARQEAAPPPAEHRKSRAQIEHELSATERKVDRLKRGPRRPEEGRRRLSIVVHGLHFMKASLRGG